jgi:hypothetical protein
MTGEPLEPGYRFSLSLMLLFIMALSFLRHFEIRLHVIPKETAAALLFALGCTTATRFLSMPERWIEPVLECGLLALIFACNLHGISLRERGAAGARHAALVLCTLVFTLALLWMIHSGAIEGALRGPAQAALGVTVLHALLHRWRDRLSVDAYRVLADLVLVLPLPLVWWSEFVFAPFICHANRHPPRHRPSRQFDARPRPVRVTRRVVSPGSAGLL